MKAIHGMTLLELIVALAVLSVLTAMAIPSLTDLLHRSQLVAVGNEFVGALAKTREQALVRNQRVTICRSNDGATCGSGSSWADGWLAFVDDANYGARDSNEEILWVREALSSGFTMSGNRPVRNYISYVGNGIARRASGAFQSGTVTLQNTYGGRRYVLSSGGRVRTEKFQ